MARVTALIWLFADEIRHFDTIPKCDGQTDRQTSSSAMVTCSKQSNKLEANDVLPNILTAHRPPKGPKMPFFVPGNLDVWRLTFTFKLIRARDQTSFLWIWRKSVQRFPRYFIHKQQSQRQRQKKQNLTQFTACNNKYLFSPTSEATSVSIIYVCRTVHRHFCCVRGTHTKNWPADSEEVEF